MYVEVLIEMTFTFLARLDEKQMLWAVNLARK